MRARSGLILISLASLIIKSKRITGRHKRRRGRRDNTSLLLKTIEPLLNIMLPLSTSTTLSKHISHEKLELAGLLAFARGGERLRAGGAGDSRRRRSSTTGTSRGRTTTARRRICTTSLQSPSCLDGDPIGQSQHLVIRAISRKANA
jgi:hypothetical protein